MPEKLRYRSDFGGSEVYAGKVRTAVEEDDEDENQVDTSDDKEEELESGGEEESGEDQVRSTIIFQYGDSEDDGSSDEIEYETGGIADLEDELESLTAPKLIAQTEGDEVEKARHTKNQRTLWDYGLDIRIRMQSCLQAANSLPPPAALGQATAKKRKLQEVVEETSSVLEDLLLGFVNLRTTQAEASPEFSENLGKRNKLKEGTRRTCEQWWTILSEMDQELDESRVAIVDKWNTRTQMASGAAVYKKFTTLNKVCP